MAIIDYKALFCVLIISSFTRQNEEEETNPFVEAAKSLLQDYTKDHGGEGGAAAAGLGTVVQSLLQSEGGKQLGGDLLSGLGNILTTAQGSNPQLLGQMVEMFSNMAQTQTEENSNVDHNNNEVRSSGRKRGDDGKPAAPAASPEVNWESMMDIAASFMSQGGGGSQGSPLEGLMNLLPALLQTGHAHHDDETEDVEEHRRHEKATSLLPPFLNTAMIYWDHFKESELGRTLWTNSGLEAIFKLFTDTDGHFQMDRIFESMENHSFRRRWIRSLTSFVAEWVKHVADPATQSRYLATIQFMGNGFLKAQGYSKAVLFDPARPTESLSLLANAVFKRQFGLKVNSAVYIKPAVAYIQDVFRLGQSKGLGLSHLSTQDIEGKLAETLNGEVLEPVLRVWRAYRFTLRVPSCDRYLVCQLNRFPPGTEGQAGLKPGVTKLSSLVASWFLSGQTGTPFWKLYNAAVEDHNCQVKYPANCSQFHEEDQRVTTEQYVHNEL
ncbi:uncharacterized protein LOC129005549 [Macrosteles quadrilineatus]|uniref:uncharacterized protein LOC129005549 n=1 Tax=Macrosteles quadrilineatus TaxID=74068 RepID=UPI0023E26566|nr:uncharacterized protein LOC129005549 [Macrosteles quadrilineatus]